MMKTNKNKIRLTESQLHRIIKESVRKVLKEVKNGIVNEDEFSEVRSNYDDGEYLYIDAWRTMDDNEEGEVVAKIDLETHNVIWCNSDAKESQNVREEIMQALKELSV